MTKKRIHPFWNLLPAGAMVSIPAAASSKPPAGAAAETASRIHHELLTLPFYGIFDNLSFGLNDGVVTLYGSVTRPALKTSAVRVVQTVPGVVSVINRIEVLPSSPFDDRVRLLVARAIYGHGASSRYSLGAHPSIRIISTTAASRSKAWFSGRTIARSPTFRRTSFMAFSG